MAPPGEVFSKQDGSKNQQGRGTIRLMRIPFRKRRRERRFLFLFLTKYLQNQRERDILEGIEIKYNLNMPPSFSPMPSSNPRMEVPGSEKEEDIQEGFNELLSAKKQDELFAAVEHAPLFDLMNEVRSLQRLIGEEYKILEKEYGVEYYYSYDNFGRLYPGFHSVNTDVNVETVEEGLNQVALGPDEDEFLEGFEESIKNNTYTYKDVDGVKRVLQNLFNHLEFLRSVKFKRAVQLRSVELAFDIEERNHLKNINDAFSEQEARNHINKVVTQLAKKPNVLVKSVYYNNPGFKDSGKYVYFFEGEAICSHSITGYRHVWMISGRSCSGEDYKFLQEEIEKHNDFAIGNQNMEDVVIK